MGNIKLPIMNILKKMPVMVLLVSIFMLKVNVAAAVDPDSGLNYTVDGRTTKFDYKIGKEITIKPGQFTDSIYYYFSVPGRTSLKLTISTETEDTKGIVGAALYEIQNGYLGKRYAYTSCWPNQTEEQDYKLDAGDYVLSLGKGSAPNATIKFVLTLENKATDFTIEATKQLECNDAGTLFPKATDKDATAHFTYTSSDPSIAAVDYNTGRVTTKNKEGKAIITCTMNGEISKKCVIIVKRRILPPPILDDQFIAYSNKIEMTIDDNGFYTRGGTFQIWRAKKKNGKYKRVKTVTKYIESGLQALWFTQKKVKPGTCYYYKVRVKRKGETYYSAFTNPKAFWTSPPEKVKMTTNNMYSAKWKKAKGATGYAVDEAYMHFNGYNIFGGKVYTFNTWTTFMKKRSYRRQYKDYGSDGTYSASTVKVRPYAKHGKKYYMHGMQVTNKRYNYDNTGGHKSVY